MTCARLILVAGLFLGGCSDPETVLERHMERGQTYLAEGDFDKARVEFRNAMQIAPKSAEVYSLLGQLEEQRQEWRTAIGYYNKALELDPAMPEPAVRLGRFYLMYAASLQAGQDVAAERDMLGKVQGYIDRVLAQDASNVEALLLRASLLAHQGRTDEAIDQLQHVLEDQPSHEEAILLLSRFYLQQGAAEENLRLLERGVADETDGTVLHIELAKQYSARQEYERAIPLMQEVIRREPGVFGHRASLAAYYTRQGELDMARQVFKLAIAADPDDAARYLAYAEFLKRQEGLEAASAFLEAAVEDLFRYPALQFRRADYYLEMQRPDAAEDLYREAIAAWGLAPPGITARKRLAELYRDRSDWQQVEKLAQAILDEYPHDGDALTLKGMLAFQRQDYETAIASLQAVLKYQPDSLPVLDLLAESYLRNGDVNLAADTFRRATDIQPDDVIARLKLARFLLAANQLDESLEQVNEVLEKDPVHLPAMVLASELHMAAANMDAVMATLDRIKREHPDSHEGWFRMARVYQLRGDNERAREELMVALEKSPLSEELLAELTDLEIAMGQSAVAEQRLDELLQQHPDHPSADKFLGMIYLLDKDYASAEKSFRLHLRKSPDDVPVYLKLAAASYGMGNLAQSVEYYRQGLLKDPRNNELKGGLAGVLELQHDYDGAISLYEEILAAKPGDVVATNNLALLLVNRKAGPEHAERALQLIQRLGADKHPALQDTLGWIHYKRGEFALALVALQQAVAAAPRVPVFHYHLGMVYLATGDKVRAEEHLRRGLAIGNFPGMEQAREVLEGLAPG